MCIANTVGAGGVNASADVRCMQLLLNMNTGSFGLSCSLIPDGRWGPGTREALAQFRLGAGLGSGQPVAPGDATMSALQRGLPAGLAKPKLWSILVDASGAQVDAFYQPIAEVLARYQVNTPLRIAHFLAQIGHESGCLRYTKEIATGEAYEGRKDLGNDQPGDGKRFKGRGLIQLTGRSNYRDYGRVCGRDFEHRDDPELVATDPALAVDVAGWFWSRRNLNELADRDDLREITRRINGGFNGLEHRSALLTRAKWLLVE